MTLTLPAMSEAPQALAAVLADHASPEAFAAFTGAAQRAGDLIDNSLPHLQELLRLSINHLALERPGTDGKGALARLADGAPTDEDLETLNAGEATEIFSWCLQGDWDFPGAPALAADVYLRGNPDISRDVVDTALAALTVFLDDSAGAVPVPGPVRDIILLPAPAGELTAAA